MWRDLFLTDRFFLFFSTVLVLFGLSFPFAFLFYVALALLVVGIALSLVDIGLLFRRQAAVTTRRITSKVLSLSDPNPIHLDIRNKSPFNYQVTVIDELPIELQIRDFSKRIKIDAGAEQRLTYEIQPLTRGSYRFGHVLLFLETPLGLAQRRVRTAEPMEVPVYPSILQMKELALKAFDRITHLQGIKKIRRIGHSYEFEQIKNYVRGDDHRSINWKATSRRNELMVNQYEDERSQQVYALIDKSRNMRMPFDGLSLMDHAINSALVMANVALQKHDKAGLITFSDVLGATIKADRKANQLNRILQSLYKEEERPLEANFELLYQASRKLIKGRSLLLLYTNFESMFALERALPVLRRVNRFHLLVVIFFKNTEIEQFAYQSVDSLEGIYMQTTAQKFVAEKQAMAQKLQQYGIQTVLTRPDELSVNTINKYLELKSRGLI
jgi:uncharacterized protein (DUF58 family)